MVHTLRIFPWTAKGADGFPVVSSPVKPIELSTETNIVQVTYTPTTVTATLRGDDRVENYEVVQSYVVEVQLYGISADFLVAAGLAVKDSKNNIHLTTSNNQHLVVFVGGKNQKGTGFQRWFHDCVARPVTSTLNTQENGAVTDPVTISFFGTPIEASSVSSSPIPYSEVYEGNQGYVSGEPTTSDYYKGA